MEGNQQKLREAVVALLDALDSLGCDESTATLAAFVPDMADSSAKCLAAFRKAKDALSAPPRQCDVGTAEEQAKRFHHQCFEYHTGRCSPHCRTLPAKTRQECALKWAQMSYEAQEGGAE